MGGGGALHRHGDDGPLVDEGAPQLVEVEEVRDVLGRVRQQLGVEGPPQQVVVAAGLVARGQPPLEALLALREGAADVRRQVRALERVLQALEVLVVRVLVQRREDDLQVVEALDADAVHVPQGGAVAAAVVAELAYAGVGEYGAEVLAPREELVVVGVEGDDVKHVDLVGGHGQLQQRRAHAERRALEVEGDDPRRAEARARRLRERPGVDEPHHAARRHATTATCTWTWTRGAR